MFFDRLLNEEVYVFPSFFPTELSESENRLICLTGPGSEKPFLSLAASKLIDLHLSGGGCSTQCFPFYTYAEDGTNRRENITDCALEQFRARYHDPSISKWDIFHYIYAVLHHPEYRGRYAANLRRELPRIPFVSACHPEAAGALAKPRTPKEESLHSGDNVTGASCIDPSAHRERGPQDDSVGERSGVDADVFRAFVKAGARLAEIHVRCEQQAEYPLTKTEKAGEKLDWRVTKMRLSRDKAALTYNQFLTLSGIPPEAYEYRLGNRSALEWVIDQYQVSTDKRSGITNDPNRAEDPQYIVRLIGQVITVSLETVKIVKALPPLGLPG
jgi:predicted helicase